DRPDPWLSSVNLKSRLISSYLFILRDDAGRVKTPQEIDLKEITMCRNDEAGLWNARSQWAPEERENFKRQIIERAQRARAQAFLDLAEVMLALPQALVVSGWRGLRRLGGRVVGVAG